MNQIKKQPFEVAFLLPIIRIILDRLQGSAISKQESILE